MPSCTPGYKVRLLQRGFTEKKNVNRIISKERQWYVAQKNDDIYRFLSYRFLVLRYTMRNKQAKRTQIKMLPLKNSFLIMLYSYKLVSFWKLNGSFNDWRRLYIVKWTWCTHCVILFIFFGYLFKVNKHFMLLLWICKWFHINKIYFAKNVNKFQLFKHFAPRSFDFR